MMFLVENGGNFHMLTIVAILLRFDSLPSLDITKSKISKEY